MSLPVSIDNVSYYYNKSFASTLAVKCFTGDLIVTKQILYFVPHTLGKYAPKGTTDLGLAGALIAEGQITTTNKSRLHQSGLWQPDETSETLQKKLDAYMADLKHKKASGNSANDYDEQSEMGILDVGSSE